jgi:hypothetical protein
VKKFNIGEHVLDKEQGINCDVIIVLQIETETQAERCSKHGDRRESHQSNIDPGHRGGIRLLEVGLCKLHSRLLRYATFASFFFPFPDKSKEIEKVRW